MKFIARVFVACLYIFQVKAMKLPGPQVYVVTPSPNKDYEQGRSAVQPFYYHNWRRMDTPKNTTLAPPTTTVKTQDLIFAEFESDKMRNIRKLLEKERIKSKTPSTLKPIVVPEEDEDIKMTQVINDYSSQPTENKDSISNGKDTTDYSALYNSNNMHKNHPVYIEPSTTTTESAKSTTSPPVVGSINNVENIWHIIDNERHHQYSGGWDEVAISPESEGSSASAEKPAGDENKKKIPQSDDDNGSQLDDNFAIPGFGTNPGNAAENESRAIRTDTDVRFPYVNLKTFQMKDFKKPSFNTYPNSKKSNMFTNLDNFREMKNPVRGEAQDVVARRQPVDRYNSAQPYLPKYGDKSKQSSPKQPMKTVANLVPPPPPPPPKVTADDFPAPSSYESFPPYPPMPSNGIPPSSYESFPPYPPMPSDGIPHGPADYQPPTDDTDDSGPPTVDDDDGPPMDLGHRYKLPSSQNFLPTLPPLIKPGDYFYAKPPIEDDNGLHDEKPDFQGYHYDKPAPAKEHDHHDEYPDLVYNKPYGPMKGADDMKGGDMGVMMPPPPPPAGPAEDSGFPQDFPVDFKHHFLDEHDFYHDHHHHHPTTTTTTEQPRVNRYSYYYLGKKLYYLPLYFSVYFIIYVGALIIKAVLRHKIVYPQSWRPNDTTAGFFSKRSIESWDPSHDNLHEITGKVTHFIATAAQKYMENKQE